MGEDMPEGPQWRLLVLESQSDHVSPRRVVLFERTEPAVSSLPRVWCQGLIDQEPWTRVAVTRAGDDLQIDLPPSEYYGMPVHLFLDCPKQTRVLGSTWPLRSENREHIHALLALTRIEIKTAAELGQIEAFYRSGRRPTGAARPQLRAMTEAKMPSAPASQAAPTIAARKTRRKDVVEISDLRVPWDQYVTIIKRQDGRRVRPYVIHIFDRKGSYLSEVETCRRAFESHRKFARMPREDRKFVAGWGEGSGWFGRMVGAGRFMNLTDKHPGKIGQALDPVPLTGDVSISAARSYLQRATSLPGVGMAAATRLLCLKRPDLFLSANKASENRVQALFGIKPATVDRYLDILARVWEFPWFLAAAPRGGPEQRLFRARVALLDAVFYEVPGYVK